jgi:hypothetical protein
LRLIPCPRGDGALDTLNKTPVHREQALAAVLADNFITRLKRRAFAVDVRLAATVLFAVCKHGARYAGKGRKTQTVRAYAHRGRFGERRAKKTNARVGL